MKLITLYPQREWKTSYNQTTILRDENNKVKAIIPSSLRQPKYGQKTIVLNCWTFALDWRDVEKPKSSYVRKRNRISGHT